MRRPLTTAQPQDPGHDGAADNQLPTAMTHAAMNSAFDAGAALLLSEAVNWVVRHRDAWWVVYENGWLRITDAATAEDLDQASCRLAEAEKVARCPLVGQSDLQERPDIPD